MAVFLPSGEGILFLHPLSHYPFASASTDMERYIYWVSGWFEKVLLVAAVAWYVRAQLKKSLIPSQCANNIQGSFGDYIESCPNLSMNSSACLAWRNLQLLPFLWLA